MERLSKGLVERLRRAVELRVRRKSWAEVASEMHYSVETCRSWPARYPQMWHALYEKADRTWSLFLLCVVRAAQERAKSKAKKSSRPAARPGAGPHATMPPVPLVRRSSDEYEYRRSAEG